MDCLLILAVGASLPVEGTGLPPVELCLVLTPTTSTDYLRCVCVTHPQIRQSLDSAQGIFIP